MVSSLNEGAVGHYFNQFFYVKQTKFSQVEALQRRILRKLPEPAPRGTHRRAERGHAVICLVEDECGDIGHNGIGQRDLSDRIGQRRQRQSCGWP